MDQLDKKVIYSIGILQLIVDQLDKKVMIYSIDIVQLIVDQLDKKVMIYSIDIVTNSGST